MSAACQHCGRPLAAGEQYCGTACAEAEDRAGRGFKRGFSRYQDEAAPKPPAAATAKDLLAAGYAEEVSRLRRDVADLVGALDRIRRYTKENFTRHMAEEALARAGRPKP